MAYIVSVTCCELQRLCKPKHASVKWAPSSEFVSSSIPSWQSLTAHAQPFRGARDLAFCLKDPLDSLLVWASSEGSGETARMRRLAWTFAARIGGKYQIRLMRSKYLNDCQHSPSTRDFRCLTVNYCDNGSTSLHYRSHDDSRSIWIHQFSM